MAKPIISLKNVWKIYHMGEVEVPALRGIDLEVQSGDFIAIIGQSGSGKSTLMNLVGCLDVPSSGSVLLRSHDITTLSESDLATLRGQTIGFVFQQYNLIPTLTALGNVLLPLELQEIDDKKAEERALTILKRVGLGEHLHHKPSQLSGGQQQRVSIARSLSANPDIILADEPTGALDSKTGKDVLQLLHTLWSKEGKTIIMVTHDLNLAQYAQTQVELKDGKVIKVTHNKHPKGYSEEP